MANLFEQILIDSCTRFPPRSYGACLPGGDCGEFREIVLPNTVHIGAVTLWQCSQHPRNIHLCGISNCPYLIDGTDAGLVCELTGLVAGTGDEKILAETDPFIEVKKEGTTVSRKTLEQMRGVFEYIACIAEGQTTAVAVPAATDFLTRYHTHLFWDGPPTYADYVAATYRAEAYTRIHMQYAIKVMRALLNILARYSVAIWHIRHGDDEPIRPRQGKIFTFVLFNLLVSGDGLVRNRHGDTLQLIPRLIDLSVFARINPRDLVEAVIKYNTTLGTLRKQPTAHRSVFKKKNGQQNTGGVRSRTITSQQNAWMLWLQWIADEGSPAEREALAHASKELTEYVRRIPHLPNFMAFMQMTHRAARNLIPDGPPVLREDPPPSQTDTGETR